MAISKNLAKLVRSLETKKGRKKEGLFVAEGPKVVTDLMAVNSPVRVIATAEWFASTGLSPSEQDAVVTDDELRKVSFLQHPQQVIALFPLPSLPAPRSPLPENSLAVALDGVQDPGNLGTIIRIADWFGIDSVVCSYDTADAWSPKVVQATMGSIARVNIVYTDLKEYLSHATIPICGTLLDGENIYAQELPREAIIVMGNEGNGISPAIRPLITHRLLIPQFRPGAESLNVAIATAITCSEFRRSAGQQLHEGNI